MKRKVVKISAFIITLLLGVMSAGKVIAAPKLTLSPVTKNVTNGQTFTVTIGVNSGTNKSNAVDVWGTYDKDKLELVSIVKAASPVYDFDFSSAPAIDDTNGTFRFSCPSNNLNSFDTTAINGELAVATFSVKASSGTARVRFDCTTDSTTDSNIFSDTNDVISCGDNDAGAYTITSGSSSTTGGSSGTTTTGGSTAQNELPQTGSVGTTIGLIVFGTVSLISAFFLKFL